SRFEKNVTRRRCNKAEDGDDRPCQNPRLPTGKPRHHLAPSDESLLHVARAMKEIVKTLRKGPGSCQRLDRVAQRHLLEREKQVRASFDRDRLCGDVAMFPAFNSSRKDAWSSVS